MNDVTVRRVSRMGAEPTVSVIGAFDELAPENSSDVHNAFLSAAHPQLLIRRLRN